MGSGLHAPVRHPGAREHKNRTHACRLARSCLWLYPDSLCPVGGVEWAVPRLPAQVSQGRYGIGQRHDAPPAGLTGPVPHPRSLRLDHLRDLAWWLHARRPGQLQPLDVSPWSPIRVWSGKNWRGMASRRGHRAQFTDLSHTPWTWAREHLAGQPLRLITTLFAIVSLTAVHIPMAANHALPAATGQKLRPERARQPMRSTTVGRAPRGVDHVRYGAGGGKVTSAVTPAPPTAPWLSAGRPCQNLL
jgi:hypothetical protein